MDDDPQFNAKAVNIAASEVESNLIAATRSFEDAQRTGDEYAAAAAMREYAALKTQYDILTTPPQQQQQPGQLSVATRNYLSRRAAGGDQIDGQRWNDYIRGHQKAVAAGLQPDTPQYFDAISHYVDHLGDGRIPPLTESEAAAITGCDPQTYAQNAAHLRALKKAGHYRQD